MGWVSSGLEAGASSQADVGETCSSAFQTACAPLTALPSQKPSLNCFTLIKPQVVGCRLQFLLGCRQAPHLVLLQKHQVLKMGEHK